MRGLAERARAAGASMACVLEPSSNERAAFQAATKQHLATRPGIVAALKDSMEGVLQETLKAAGCITWLLALV